MNLILNRYGIKKPLFVQEIFTPIKQVNNPLSTGAETVQLVHPILAEYAQVKPIYIFPKTSICPIGEP